jgi:hypothetical protein
MTTDYSQIPGGEDAWIEAQLAQEVETQHSRHCSPELGLCAYDCAHFPHDDPRANDTPWGPEVDAAQDRDADAEWTPPPKLCGHGRRIGHCDWCETLKRMWR